MNTTQLIEQCELELKEQFKAIDQLSYKNSTKVLDAFHKNSVSEAHFGATSGYGYNDLGRDVIERVFADVLGAEDALVRNQILSGTHAITVALFGILRPNDVILSVTGTPYDTIHEVIGIKENPSSLKAHGIKYDEIDLVNNLIDLEAVANYLKNNKTKVVYVQRSIGYSNRKTITLEQIKDLVECVKKIDNNVIVMIDNCYCEFVDDETPLAVGADIIIGSLIKNLGGFIAPTGGYIAGKTEYIELISERLTVPGQGKEVGCSLGINKQLLQGLYLAPSVVASSLKIAILTSKVLEKLGYNVDPKWDEKRSDIVQKIIFNDPDMLIKYCQGIQSGSAIDANAVLEPTDMPGYDDKIIMASGSFNQGSSIEISCDGPLRSPYIAYQQGGVTYDYGKIALMAAIDNLNK